MDPTPDYDRIARPYRFLEWLAFGSTLQEARTAFLKDLVPRRSILILGEGDGRFIQELTQHSLKGSIVVVEPSRTMIRLAERRLSDEARSRVAFFTDDIRLWSPPKDSLPFDALVTLFFWDQYPPEEQESIVTRLQPWLQPGAAWLFADFSETRPKKFPQAFARDFALRALYRFFQRTTGIPARFIHDPCPFFMRFGWSRKRRASWKNEWIQSDLWVKNNFDKPVRG